MQLPVTQAVSHAVGRFVSSNATTILTGAGVVGVVATGVLATRATFKAAELIADAELELSDDGGQDVALPLGAKIKLVAPHYIPTIFVGGLAITSIIMSNRVSAKQAAALAAAYGISQDRLQEYKNKMAEKLPGAKGEKAKDEIAQDRIDKNPPREVIIIGTGDVLCYDEYSGRYFRASHEAIMRSMNKLNDELINHNSASLSSFYDKIGLPHTGFSNEVGWNTFTTGPLDIRITTAQGPNNEPCLSIDFVVPPRPEYQDTH